MIVFRFKANAYCGSGQLISLVTNSQTLTLSGGITAADNTKPSYLTLVGLSGNFGNGVLTDISHMV
jgi:hypothetical protein